MDYNEVDRRYRARLRLAANKIIGDWHEADATANEAIFAALRSFNPARGSLESLLFTTTRNKARNYVAKRNRLKRRGTVALVAEPVVWGDDPGLRESIERVTTALDTLPADQREVIRLRYYDGLSERAAAKQIGITRHRLRELQSAALEALRAAA